jgi:hypothetical protein
MMNRSVMERQMFKDGGAAFPDLSGDGRITRKDILMGRGVQFMQEGGDVAADSLRQRLLDLASGGTTEQVQTFIRNNIADMEAAGLLQNRFVRGLIENVTGMSPEEVAAGGMVPPPMAPPETGMVPPPMAPLETGPMGLVPMSPGVSVPMAPPETGRERIPMAPPETGMVPPPMAPPETGRERIPMAPPETGRERIPMAPSEMEMMLEELRRRAEEQNRLGAEMMDNLPIGKQEGGVIEPPMMDPAMMDPAMMDPAMMAGGSPAQMMMAEQQVMDAPPVIRQAAEEQVQAGLPMVENALNQFAMNTGGKDVEDAETFEEMMNMVRGFPATTSERREELAELVGPEDASQTPDSVLAMVQPIIGLTALDQGIGSLAREEMGEAPPMGGIMDMAAAPGGMMVEENIPV